jgi:hypothetical protein
MTALNLVGELVRHKILCDHFKAVPEEYVIRGEHGATVRCLCDRLTDLSNGQVTSCGCGRIFLGGSGRVYAAPAPLAAEDHDCEAGRATLADGTVVVLDYCAECMADL